MIPPMALRAASPQHETSDIRSAAAWAEQRPGAGTPGPPNLPCPPERTNTQRFIPPLLACHALPSRLNRASGTGDGVPTYPGGIFPYYTARCIIRKNAVRGSIILLA